MIKAKEKITDFSSHLFWDTDRNKLDFEKNKKYIIKQVLDYGLLNDWNIIQDVYGLAEIVKAAKIYRELDKKTLSFISTLSNEPLDSFRCYSYRQSIPQHWNF